MHLAPAIINAKHPTKLKAIALNGTSKPSGREPSSTDRILDLIARGPPEKACRGRKHPVGQP